MGKVSKQRKVTNAYLAQLLGLKRGLVQITPGYYSTAKPPDFLHSLDATVKEMERLGLTFDMASQMPVGRYMARVHTCYFCMEKGAALTLATALARYLESRVP